MKIGCVSMPTPKPFCCCCLSGNKEYKNKNGDTKIVKGLPTMGVHKSFGIIHYFGPTIFGDQNFLWIDICWL